MEIVSLIISICALALSVIAFVKAGKKNTDTVKETVMKESAATITERPFAYDAEKHQYVLDGDLKVKGGVTCLYSVAFGEE
jgi:hypothetical protein